MKTAFFHKGKGSKTRSSDFSGLRMRDGDGRCAAASSLNPVRGQTERKQLIIGDGHIFRWQTQGSGDSTVTVSQPEHAVPRAGAQKGVRAGI